MEWISVKSKIPETRQDVLFAISKSYGGGKAQEGVFVLNYENEYGSHGSVFISANKGFFPIGCVDFWMELPEPPTN